MKKSKVPITVFFIICTVLVAVLARLEEIAQFNAKLNEKRIKEEEYLEEHTYLPYQTPVVSSEDSTIQDDVQNAVQLISSSLDLPNSTSELPVENKSLAPRSSDSSVEDWSDVKVVNSHPALSHVSHISDSDDDWDDVQPIESKSNPKIKSDDDWDDVQPIESKSNIKQKKNNSDLVIPPPVSSQRSHRMNRRRVIKASDSWSNDDWDDVQPNIKPQKSIPDSSTIKSDDDWDDVKPMNKPIESKSNSTIKSDDDWDDVQPIESKSNVKQKNNSDLVIPPPVSSQRSHRMNRRRVIKASDSWSNDDWDDVQPMNKSTESKSNSKIKSDDDWDDVQPIVKPTESKSNSRIESDDDWDDVKPIEFKSNPKIESDDDWDDVQPTESKSNPKIKSDDDWDDVQPMNKPIESKSNPKIKSDDDWDDVQPIESKSNPKIESDDDWDDIQPIESKSNPKIESDDDWDDIQPNPSPNSSKIESVKSRQNPPQLTHRRRNKKLTVDMKLWSKTLLDGSVSINDQTPSATSSRDSRNSNPDSKESESGDSASVESTSFNSPKGNKAVATALSTIPDFDFLSSSTLPLFS